MNTSFKVTAGVLGAVAALLLVLFSLRAAQGRSIPHRDTAVARHDVGAAAFGRDRNGLSGVLREYDRQIAALRATLHAAAFSGSTAQINGAINELRTQVASGASTIDAAIARNANEYAAREDAAVSAVLATAGTSAPSRSAVAQRVQRDYEAEYAQLRSGAGSDMNAYRDALQAQERQAYTTFVNSVNARTQQAYFNRAQELREQESTLLLDLARADAPRRMILRAKLQTLALSGSARAAIETQLARIQAREDAALAAARSRDGAILERYRAALVQKANNDVAQMSVQLQARMQANLAARRDVFIAQRAQPAALPIGTSTGAPNGAAPDLRSRVSAIRSRGASDFRAQANAAIAAYTAAGEDIANRFGAIRDSDAASTRATLAAIAQLEHDRAALAERIGSY